MDAAQTRTGKPRKGIIKRIILILALAILAAFAWLNVYLELFPPETAEVKEMVERLRDNNAVSGFSFDLRGKASIIVLLEPFMDKESSETREEVIDKALRHAIDYLDMLRHMGITVSPGSGEWRVGIDFRDAEIGRIIKRESYIECRVKGARVLKQTRPSKEGEEAPTPI